MSAWQAYTSQRREGHETDRLGLLFDSYVNRTVGFGNGGKLRIVSDSECVGVLLTFFAFALRRMVRWR